MQYKEKEHYLEIIETTIETMTLLDSLPVLALLFCGLRVHISQEEQFFRQKRLNRFFRVEEAQQIEEIFYILLWYGDPFTEKRKTNLSQTEKTQQKIQKSKLSPAH